MKTKFVSFLLVVSSLAWGQIPDTLEIKSGPAGISSAVAFLPFVEWKRSYNPLSMGSIEFREPYGLGLKGGQFREHRFVLNGIPLNSLLTNDLPLLNSRVSVGSGFSSGMVPGQSSGVIFINQPVPGNHLRGRVELSSGNYLPAGTKLFPDPDVPGLGANKNLRFSVSGPVSGVQNLSYSIDGFFDQDGGYLAGRNVYKVWEGPLIKATGDSSETMMNGFSRRSLSGRVFWNSELLSLDFFVLYTSKRATYYSFNWLLTPDGNLTHFQENLVTGLTANLNWSPACTQILKLSWQPNHTWGYWTRETFNSDYLNGSYLSSGRYAVTDQDQFFSSAGGIDGRRYRHHADLFLVALENSYKFSEGQSLFLNLQSESIWYQKTAGYLMAGQTNETEGNQKKLFFTHYKNDFHPYFFSAVAGHESDILLNETPIQVSSGIKTEFFRAGKQLSGYWMDDNYLIHKVFNGKDSGTKMEWLPFLYSTLGVTENLSVAGSFSKSADWHELGILYGLLGRSSGIGDTDLEPLIWTNFTLGVKYRFSRMVEFDFNWYSRATPNHVAISPLMYDSVLQDRFNKPLLVDGDVALSGGEVGVSLKIPAPAGLFSDDIRLLTMVTLQKAVKEDMTFSYIFSDNTVETTSRALRFDAFFAFVSGTNLEIRYQVKSGVPYKKLDGFLSLYNITDGGQGDIFQMSPDSEMPVFYQMDVRIEQKFSLHGLTGYLFAEAENLFDTRNLLTVYPQTGASTLFGDSFLMYYKTSKTYKETGAENPDFYSPPRKIALGMAVEF